MVLTPPKCYLVLAPSLPSKASGINRHFSPPPFSGVAGQIYPGREAGKDKGCEEEWKEWVRPAPRYWRQRTIRTAA